MHSWQKCKAVNIFGTYNKTGLGMQIVLTKTWPHKFLFDDNFKLNFTEDAKSIHSCSTIVKYFSLRSSVWGLLMMVHMVMLL